MLFNTKNGQAAKLFLLMKGLPDIKEQSAVSKKSNKLINLLFRISRKNIKENSLDRFKEFLI